MPFLWCALLSGALVAIGLVGLLWRNAPLARAMSAALMLNGVILLLVAAAMEWRQVDGQAVALLVLGLLPVEYVVGLAIGNDDGSRTGRGA